MIEARLQPLLRHMPTYHVQQTWRAKRPKTVVSHDLENPSQPPKSYHQSQLREFAKDRSKRDAFIHHKSQRQRTLRLLLEDCRFIYFHS